MIESSCLDWLISLARHTRCLRVSGSIRSSFVGFFSGKPRRYAVRRRSISPVTPLLPPPLSTFIVLRQLSLHHLQEAHAPFALVYDPSSFQLQTILLRPPLYDRVEPTALTYKIQSSIPPPYIDTSRSDRSLRRGNRRNSELADERALRGEGQKRGRARKGHVADTIQTQSLFMLSTKPNRSENIHPLFILDPTC